MNPVLGLSRAVWIDAVYVAFAVIATVWGVARRWKRPADAHSSGNPPNRNWYYNHPWTSATGVATVIAMEVFLLSRAAIPTAICFVVTLTFCRWAWTHPPLKRRGR
jgi:hypothetical protein